METESDEWFEEGNMEAAVEIYKDPGTEKISCFVGAGPTHQIRPKTKFTTEYNYREMEELNFRSMYALHVCMDVWYHAMNVRPNQLDAYVTNQPCLTNYLLIN